MPQHSTRDASSEATPTVQAPAQNTDALQSMLGNSAVDLLTSAVPAEASRGIADYEALVRRELGANVSAKAVLAEFTADAEYLALSEADRARLLAKFRDAPNPANATYLEGIAGIAGQYGGLAGLQRAAADGAPDLPAALSEHQDKLKADGGHMVLDGQRFNIREGSLINKDGVASGEVWNDGNYQLNGQADATSVYSDLDAEVNLQENGKELLDLHDADSANRLDNENMNPELVGRASNAMSGMRAEGMDPSVVSGYRSIAAQNVLYQKGRTTRGPKVTNAKGGQSWHNYGLSMDIAFNKDNGQPTWEAPERDWTRYGEHARGNGMTWGGDWTRFTDRPHVELHRPGASPSRQLATANAGGLEAVWSNVGVGTSENVAKGRPDAGASEWDKVRKGSLTLRNGSRGDAVAEMQTRLAVHGYDLKSDGKFGGGTETALMSFQQTRGITADGIVGKDTARLLDSAPTGSRQSGDSETVVDASSLDSQAPTTSPRPRPRPEGLNTTLPAGHSEDDGHDHSDHSTSEQQTDLNPAWAKVISGGELLHTGKKGEAVEHLQKLLNKMGESLAVDGDYGRGTRRAVARYQRMSGLAVDGRVGAATAAAMEASSQAAGELGIAPGWSFVELGKRVLMEGHRGDVVRTLQKLLYKAGIGTRIDGIFTPETELLVRQFQEQNGLQVDGKVGKNTASALTPFA